ncbi:MAG: hypothetical protein N3F09_08315 [Bacteroidia bacterium]|nr:hypothetical protein [Bacteroidia bacterium]
MFFILTYPLFYYAYKFGSPDFGNIDFYHYYHLYKDFDIEKVQSPFNIRLVSPFLVYLFYKSGIYYNAEISYHNPMIDQQVFFSSIAVNYLFFVGTLVVVMKLIEPIITNTFTAFLTTLIYGYSFATLFYTLNTLTESASVFMFALAFYYYLKRNFRILLILFVAVFQREYILMAFGLIALYDFVALKENKKFFISVFIGSVLFFTVYIVLRKTYFYTPHHDEQFEVGKFFYRLLNPGFPAGEYIRQSFLNQNIFLLYLFLVTYKLINKIQIQSKHSLFLNILLYVQVNLISIFAVLGNSTGRYFSLLLPLTFYSLVLELKKLLPQQENFPYA